MRGKKLGNQLDMKVLFLPEVVDQFLELAQILYDKGYLNSKDAAIEYSEKLFREIQTKLPLKVKKEAPAYYKRYGSDILYSAFRHSCHTTWYVLYSAYNVDGDTVFLVRHLTNNHVIAHRLGLDLG